MTDVSNWAKFVNVVKLRYRDTEGSYMDLPNGEPIYTEYVQVPFNDYQIGNLLGALARTDRNGDWWNEVLSILLVAMDEAGIKEIGNNFGDRFSIEDIRRGQLRVKE